MKVLQNKMHKSAREIASYACSNLCLFFITEAEMVLFLVLNISPIYLGQIMSIAYHPS